MSEPPDTGKLRNMVDTPDDPILIGAREAELIRKHPAQVTRARQDPTHPAHPNAPTAVGVAPYLGAPRSLILAWWRDQGVEPGQDRPRSGRPRKTTPAPQPAAQEGDQ